MSWVANTDFAEDSMGWEEAIGWVRSVTKLDIWLKGGKYTQSVITMQQ